MNSGKTENFRFKRFVLGPLQSNCYLVYDDSTLEGVIIDPGWHDGPMMKEISNLKIKLRYVINTHGHADHIAGNTDFAAPVLIHHLDEGCLNDPVRNMSYLSGFPIKTQRAGMVLKDNDVISVGRLTLEILHTPGHTPGGISVKCLGNVFTGDTLFFEGIGRTDLEGGNLDTILKSIDEKLMTLPDDVKVFPGHGCSTTIGDARRFMVREFSSRKFGFSRPGEKYA